MSMASVTETKSMPREENSSSARKRCEVDRANLSKRHTAEWRKYLLLGPTLLQRERQNVGFTRGLVGVKSEFNPIAAYYENPAKAHEMTLTPLARERDSEGFMQEANKYHLAKEHTPQAP